MALGEFATCTDRVYSAPYCPLKRWVRSSLLHGRGRHCVGDVVASHRWTSLRPPHGSNAASMLVKLEDAGFVKTLGRDERRRRWGQIGFEDGVCASQRRAEYKGSGGCIVGSHCERRCGRWRIIDTYRSVTTVTCDARPRKIAIRPSNYGPHQFVRQVILFQARNTAGASLAF